MNVKTIDKEKVIKGLECCLAATECGICPYSPGDGLWCGYNDDQLLEDALALLKVQESRLVTAEDFANADKYGFLPVWTEEKDGDLYCECIPSVAITDEDYKAQYRFWTSRPTDEQREVTPWEA